MSSALRTLRDGRVIVATQFVPRDDSPTALNYVMKLNPAGWQVVDVLAEGSISRVDTAFGFRQPVGKRWCAGADLGVAAQDCVAVGRHVGLDASACL